MYKAFHIDLPTFLLYVLVSFSFPNLAAYTLPALLVVSSYHCYQKMRQEGTLASLVIPYFLLLVYSMIFFRSVHTLLLIILLCMVMASKGPQKNQPTNTIFGIVIGFFVLILVNHLLFKSIFKGLDTYLYLLFYPILFYLIQRKRFSIPVIAAIRILITGTLMASVMLLAKGVFQKTLPLSTHTFFAEPLDLSHVYFGMFLGISMCLLTHLFLTKRYWLHKYVDLGLFVFFLCLFVYIGGRMSLLAVLFTIVVMLYKTSPRPWFQKVTVIIILSGGFLGFTYVAIPRAKDDIKYVQKLYRSIETNNHQDIVANSWRNMYQRYLVTKYTLSEIKAHPFMGIGLQPVISKLSKRIHKDGFKYFEAINPHNQYLHILVAMGIFSFCYFMGMLYYFLRAMDAYYFVLLFFLIIMLTESILVRVKGISLFFMLVLMLTSKPRVKHA